MRRIVSGTAAALIGLALLTGAATAASLDGLAVDVKNESEPVLCAEKDNVALSMANPDVRSFRIEAAHPVYLSSDGRNNWEPREVQALGWGATQKTHGVDPENLGTAFSARSCAISRTTLRLSIPPLRPSPR